MAHASIFVILVMVSVALAQKRFPPNTFRAMPDDEIQHHPQFKRTLAHRANPIMPRTFDARKDKPAWAACKSISLIRDQGQCGTCWAVSSASVISDRLCIASGGKINAIYSANQAAGCSNPDSDAYANCKDGGDVTDAYKYAAQFGLNTGGEYNSNDGCVPYTVGPSQEIPVSCATSCTNTDFRTPMATDAKLIDSYWINYKPSSQVMTQAEIDKAVDVMKQDIFANGPITAAFTVWSDFQDWTPTKGPYMGHSSSAINKGGHAVRIIGWSEANGIPYWLIANSWGSGPYSGDKGIYWMRLGRNVEGIENHASAPIVSLPSSCIASSFCDSNIDLAVNTDVNNPASTNLLFQGNCTLQVTITPSGKLAAVAGSAGPIGKSVLSAPDAPIVTMLSQDDQVWLVNDQGTIGADCKKPSSKAKKLECGQAGSKFDVPVAARKEVQFKSGGGTQKYTYVPGKEGWLFNANGQGINCGTTISAELSTVTGMINIDGRKMAVFGKSKATGAAVSGIMSYPSGSTGFAWVQKPIAKGALTC